MSARIGLKLQGLEKLKRNRTRTNADSADFRVLFLTVFTLNFEFANNFSVFQYSTLDSHIKQTTILCVQTHFLD